MSNNVKTKKISYDVGALTVFIISLGVAAVIYSAGLLVFEPLDLLVWALCPFGAYTVIYAFMARKDILYYASWGLIIFAIGLSSALYKMVNVVVIFGFLLIVLAVIGLIAYLRGKG